MATPGAGACGPCTDGIGLAVRVFLVTDLLGGVDRWHRNDGVLGGRQQLLGPADVAAMSQRGCSFHSHSCTHASLTGLPDAALARELSDSMAALASLVGPRDFYLAYPYGHVDARVSAAARAAGYKAGFSVLPGFNRPDVDPFRLRRIDVFGTDTPRELLRKIRYGTTMAAAATLALLARAPGGSHAANIHVTAQSPGHIGGWRTLACCGLPCLSHVGRRR